MGLNRKFVKTLCHGQLHNKTHLIHRPIDICATFPLRLIKGTLSFLSLGGANWLTGWLCHERIFVSETFGLETNEGVVGILRQKRLLQLRELAQTLQKLLSGNDFENRLTSAL